MSADEELYNTLIDDLFDRAFSVGILSKSLRQFLDAVLTRNTAAISKEQLSRFLQKAKSHKEIKPEWWTDVGLRNSYRDIIKYMRNALDLQERKKTSLNCSGSLFYTAHKGERK